MAGRGRGTERGQDREREGGGSKGEKRRGRGEWKKGEEDHPSRKYRFRRRKNPLRATGAFGPKRRQKPPHEATHPRKTFLDAKTSLGRKNPKGVSGFQKSSSPLFLRFLDSMLGCLPTKKWKKRLCGQNGTKTSDATSPTRRRIPANIFGRKNLIFSKGPERRFWVPEKQFTSIFKDSGLHFGLFTDHKMEKYLFFGPLANGTKKATRQSTPAANRDKNKKNKNYRIRREKSPIFTDSG